MTEKQFDPLDPVEAFLSLSLEAVDAAIAEVEKQIVETVEPLNKRRDALKACRKALAVRDEGAFYRKPRKPRGTNKKAANQEASASTMPTSPTLLKQDPPSDTSRLRLEDRIIALLQVSGPMSVRGIAQQVKAPRDTDVEEIVSDTRRFERHPYGKYTLVVRS